LSQEEKEQSVEQWVQQTSTQQAQNELEKFAYEIAETVVSTMEKHQVRNVFYSRRKALHRQLLLLGLFKKLVHICRGDLICILREPIKNKLRLSSNKKSKKYQSKNFCAVIG
jgi:hypothetical protein